MLKTWLDEALPLYLLFGMNWLYASGSYAVASPSDFLRQ